MKRKDSSLLPVSVASGIAVRGRALEKFRAITNAPKQGIAQGNLEGKFPEKCPEERPKNSLLQGISEGIFKKNPERCWRWVQTSGGGAACATAEET